MAPVIRILIGLLAGIGVAIVLLIAVELFSAVVHPFPPEFENTPEAMCAHVEKYPPWVLAVVVPMWGYTCFLSTWFAKRIGGLGAGVPMGVLLVVGVVCNVAMLPYPLWFELVIVPVCGAGVGWALWGGGRRPEVTAA